MKYELRGTKKEIIKFTPENEIEKELLSKLYHKKLTIIFGADQWLLVKDYDNFWTKK